MKRWAVLTYGVVCYAMFLGVCVYYAGFLLNLVVPTAVDGPATGPLWQALAVNTGLVLLFGLQHSVMARPTFKKWWTRIVPKPVERSTYVLFSNLALIALFAFWQPTGIEIWNLESPLLRGVMYAMFAIGLSSVVAVTFLIDHFDLFGLRQSWLYFRGKEYTPIKFRSPGPYKIVRHPLYVGWIVSFWATPAMGLMHFLFAAGMTTYILVAIYFEERNLAEEHGESYEEYRKTTPKLIPRFGAAGEAPVSSAV